MLSRELMTTPAITMREDETLAAAARLLIDKRVSGIPIVDAAGKLVGILTSTDLAPSDGSVPHSDVHAVQLFRRWLGPGGLVEAYREAERIPLKDVMNRDPVTARPDEPIERIAELMLEHGINHVPVVEDGRVIGIVTRHDFLRLAARSEGAES